MRPRLRLAIADRAPRSVAGLSRWTHQVGVTGGTGGNDTPTWNAIELSSPVAFCGWLSDGELNSWHSDPPPSRGRKRECLNQFRWQLNPAAARRCA